jgi:hypothetical protein
MDKSRQKIKNYIKKLVKESIENKYTCVKKSWGEMMEDLSNTIDKPIVMDDAGNFTVCECEPYHISIRPIVHDIFDAVAHKDGCDRTKVLYIKYDDLKKFVKDYLNSDALNYVDDAHNKAVENSKDKEGGSKSNDVNKDLSVNSDGKAIKSDDADDMNKEKDNPDEPMSDVEDFKKMVDYPEKKKNYKQPKLSPDLKKLVIKYGKKGRGRPRK